MPRRSWMAALALFCGSLGGVVILSTPSTFGADDPPAINTVSLQLEITGLTAGPSSIEIKPGHPACQFATVKREVTADVGGVVRLAPIRIDARSQGADRDCSFAITIREPGQEAKTFRRGLRLSTPEPGSPAPSQTLKLYLSAPSLAAKDLPVRPR